MTTRTDIHSPKNFNPEAYSYVGVAFSGDTALPAFMEPQVRTVIDNHEHGVPSRSLYQCDHCGAWHKYTTIFLHENGEWVSVGEDCAAGRFSVPDRAIFEMRYLRRATANRRAAAKKDAAMQEYLEAHPEMADAFEWTEEMWSRLDEFHRQIDENYGDDYYPKDGFDEEAYDITKREMTSFERLVGFNFMTIRDIENKLRRFGSISEKQEAFVLRLHQEGQEKLAKAQERQEKAEAMEPVKAGRYEVTGKVVSTKTYENDFGITHKMLVELPTGHRVFGTIPSSLLETTNGWVRPDFIKEETVTFTARFAPKPGANDFATFSRPSKASMR